MPTRHSTAVSDIDQLRQLVIKAQRGDRRALDAVIDQCKGLVGGIAKRYIRGSNTFEDCFQNGIIGLLTAVEKFDGSRGTAFTTMAVPWIRQACQRAMHETGYTITFPSHIHLTLMKLDRAQKELRAELGREPTRKEIAARAEVPWNKAQDVWNVPSVCKSLDEPVTQEGDSTVLLGELAGSENLWLFEDFVANEQLRAAVEALPDIQRHIICLRFGFYGDDPMSLSKIGTILKLSAEGVRLNERRALATLRGEITDVVQTSESETADHK